MTALAPDVHATAIATLDRLFAGRRDKYLVYRFGTQKGEWVTAELTPAIWRRHVAGVDVIGVAPLMRDGDRTVCRWACIDIDQDETPGRAEEMARVLCDTLITHHELAPIAERTKSGQVHVWLFFADWIDAWKIRGILTAMFKTLDWKDRGGKKGSETAIFPAVDAMREGGTSVGCYVPLSAHFSGLGRQVFYDWRNGTVFSDQMDALDGITPMPVDLIEHAVSSLGLKPPNVLSLHRGDTQDGVVKAEVGAIPALLDVEFETLCAKLPSLRELRHRPTGAGYAAEWFAGIVHLVPFADGRTRAHQLSQMDSGRYNRQDCDRQYDAAVVMYQDDSRQPGARVSQLIVEHWRQGGRPDITPISTKYCVWQEGYARRVYKDGANGKPVEGEPVRLTNFTVQIMCEEHRDDGAGGIERMIRFRGTLAGGAALGEHAIKAEDWTNVRVWLHRAWGMRPVVHKEDSLGGTGEVLRVVALQHQDVEERRLFTHTGWCKAPSGGHVFMLASGPAAGDPADIAALLHKSDIAVHEKLAQYRLPEKVNRGEVERAFDWIEAFLECADMKITAPLVAMQFLAPLYSFIRPNIALWLAGKTGSLKSSITAAIGNLWGTDWTYDHLPATWFSTAKGILEMGFQAKDVPFVIDNFVPDGDKRAQAKVVEVAHQIGDHSNRDKLTAESQLRSSKPVRTLVISTGEDMPSGAGAAARFYVVPMFMGDVKSMALEEVQYAGERGELQPAMKAYLEWLAVKLKDPGFLRRVRDHFKRLERDGRLIGAEHLRLPTQTAWIKVGLALAKAVHPRGKWKSPILEREIDTALAKSVALRNAQQQTASLSYRFLSALQYLITVGVVSGTNGKGGGVPPIEPELFGWRKNLEPWSAKDPEAAGWIRIYPHARTSLWVVRDGATWFVAIDPNEIVTLIKESLRNGNPIVETRAGIASNLISDRVLERGGDMVRTTEEKQFSGMPERRHLWLLHGPRYLEILGNTIAAVRKSDAKKDGL